MTKYVFVVEMYIDDRREPCAGIGIDRGQAEMTRREWEENNPDDRFRVARYERKEKPLPTTTAGTVASASPYNFSYHAVIIMYL